MSADKMLRERLRVERGAVGTSHPLIVTSMVVRKANGEEVVRATPPRENPLTTPFAPR